MKKVIYSNNKSKKNAITVKTYQLILLLIGCSLFLGGCTSYHLSPLSDNSSLVHNINKLDATDVLYEINSSNELSLTTIAILAVNNNPNLKAQRKLLGVAGAELYSSKLFPDPQLSAGLDHPRGSAPDIMNAFAVGLDYDIIPLINRGARVKSSKHALQQVNLELLWKEWQVSQQARSMAIRWNSEKEQISLLENMQKLYETRYNRSTKALKCGDLTLDINGTDLTALFETLSEINQLQEDHNNTDHDLHLLLGLAPDVVLSIAPAGKVSSLTKKQFTKQLTLLPKSGRPDLLALQAGYKSQEEKVRAAILSQFPSIGISINHARDTGGIYTTGLSIGINFPIFSGNRGTIAIARATREQLQTEYQARLDQTTMDADKLFHLQNILNDQQRIIDEHLPTLEKLTDHARKAYNSGDIDALTFLNMETTWINKRLEQIKLHQAQWETQIALNTLLSIQDTQIMQQILNSKQKETNHE